MHPVAARRILRLSLGTACCLLFSQMVAWPLSFIAPVLTLALLVVYLAFIPFNFRAPFENREVLISYNAMLFAVMALLLGAKAKALLDGRTNVSVEDIQFIAKPVLRHRLVTNFTAESEGVTADSVVDQILQATPTNHDELTNDARFQAIFAS
mgnify:CR=1 FL=1